MRLRRFKPHEIRAIRRLLHSGETGVKVAKAFRTSPQHVSLIKVRRLHATVPDDSPYGRRNWHPIELLPTAEEVDRYYTKEEAKQAEHIRRSELTPVQREVEDAERNRRFFLTPVQRAAEDAERRSQSEVSKAPPALSVTHHIVNDNGLGWCGVDVGPSKDHATTEEQFIDLAKLGVDLCEKCVSVTVSRQRARKNLGSPLHAR